MDTGAVLQVRLQPKDQAEATSDKPNADIWWRQPQLRTGSFLDDPKPSAFYYRTEKQMNYHPKDEVSL